MYSYTTINIANYASKNKMCIHVLMQKYKK